MRSIKNSEYFALIRYLPSVLKRRLIILAPLLGLAGALEVISLASIIPLGTVALDPDKAAHWMSLFHVHGTSYFHALAFFAGATVFIFCAKSLFVFLVTRYALHTASRARAFFQTILFDAYVNAPYSYHLKKNSSDYIRNITSECNSLDARFLTPAVVLIAEIVPVVFIVALLAAVNPVGLLISAVIFMLSGYCIIRLTAKRLQALGENQLRADGQLIQLAQQSFHSPKEVAIYQIQGALVKRITRLADESSLTVSKAQTLNQLPRFAFEIMSLISVIVVATVALSTGTSIHDLIVQLGIFFGAVLKLLPSSNKIANHFQALNHARPTVVNIVGELQSAHAATLASRPDATRPEPDIGAFDSLQAEGLGFAFADRAPIFSDLNFTIRKGNVVGLIGETGSGKTTLINLLLGLLPPSSGRVLINGRAIDGLRSQWNRLVSYVPQEIYLLDDTVANNIAFFEKDDEIDAVRVEEALRQVGMHEYVSSLPLGIYASLGEHGSRLSGGQRQRIGIARALYRNPDVLIFDEATSALDSQTEAAITESVGALKGEKTIIMIAHRLTSLISCDTVFRLNGGQIDKMNSEQFRAMFSVGPQA